MQADDATSTTWLGPFSDADAEAIEQWRARQPGVACELDDHYGAIVRARLVNLNHPVERALSDTPPQDHNAVVDMLNAYRAVAESNLKRAELQSARIVSLAEAAEELLSVIDKAGGPVQLSYAVQLGQMSWMAKCSGAIEWLRAELDR